MTDTRQPPSHHTNSVTPPSTPSAQRIHRLSFRTQLRRSSSPKSSPCAQLSLRVVFAKQSPT